MRPALGAATSVVSSIVVAGSALATVPAGAADWTPATTLSAPGTPSNRSTVSVDASGRATAAWIRRYSDTAGIIRSAVQASTRPVGGQWAAPVDLGVGARDAARPVVTHGPGGLPTVVWAERDGVEHAVRSSSLTGSGTWSAPVELAGMTTNLPGFLMAYDADAAADGTTTVAWSDDGLVQSSTRSTDGSWSSAVDLSPADQYANRVDLDVASTGATTVVWESTDADTPPMPAPERHIGAATRDVAGAWSGPVDVVSGASAHDPLVAVDAGGTSTVVWTVGPDDGLRAASRPAAGSWSSPSTVTTGTVQLDDVAVAPGGEVTAVWTRTSGADLVVQSATATGFSWGGSIDLSAPSGMAYRPTVEVDAHGNTVAAWFRQQPSAIMTARRAAGGAWSAASELSPAGGMWPTEPALSFDGQGYAVAVWDRSNGADNIVQSRTWDAVAPVISAIDAPTRARTLRPAGFSVTASDAWPPVSATWDFGDGTTATGTTVEHAYRRAGTYTTRVTVADAAGNTSTRTATTAVSWSRPGLTVTSSRKAIHRQGSARSPRRTKLKLGLTQGAKVTILVKRAGRQKATARLTRRFAAGDRTVRLTSRIGGRSLAPGRYSLVVRAKNGHGTSRTVKVPLRIKR